MTQQPPRISGSMRCAAIGATIAMLPAAFFMLLAAFEIIKNIDEAIATALIVVQFIGCLIWAGGLTNAISNSKRLDVKTSGIALCIIGILLGGLLQLIFNFDDNLQEKAFSILYGSDEIKSFIIILLVALAINLPLAIGTAKIGSRLQGLRGAIFPYSVLAAFPVVILILSKIILKKSSYYYSYSYSAKSAETLIKVIIVILFVCALSTVIAWWRAVSSAKEVEEEAENDGDEFIAEPTYIEQPVAEAAPVQTQHTAYSQPQSAATHAPAFQISPEQKKLLMGMSDNELSNVIRNPTLYANPAFVEEAQKMLTKRQAWEAIKDYTDEQLLSVVHENIQGFAPEVLDAASMELLSRENPDFIAEVSALSTEELQGILSNADSYYDGYIQLATSILNQRINPTA